MRPYEEFSRRVAEEAAAEGPEAVEELRAFEDYYRLARQLAERRLALRKTQTQLAAETGIRQSEISRIEQAHGNPTYHTLAKLARGLGLQFGFCGETTRGQETERDRAAV
jgi:DNA-binding phage protein